MNFKEEIVAADSLVKIVCSNPFAKSADYSKISLRPLMVVALGFFKRKNLPKRRLFTKISVVPTFPNGFRQT